MSDTNDQLAVSNPPATFVKASTALSQQLGLEPRAMIDAIKGQFFKGKEATDAQLAVVVSIARELKLNPLIPGQLYPYPDRSGSVTVMIGPDGIYTMLANNSDIVAQADGGPAYWTEHGFDSEKKQTCTGYINHRTKGLLKKTIWVDEWVVSSNPNWSSRKHHMAEIRALKQAARMVIHGIPADSDEQKLGEMLNVTPEETAETPASTEAQNTRPEPRKRSAKGAATVVENADKPAETVTTGAGQVIDIAAEKIAPAKESEADAAKAHAAAQALKKDETEKAEAELFKAPVARAFLKDGETFETVITVKEVTTLIANIAQADGSKKATPSVKAQVSGGFVGEVYHFGGATAEGDKLKPLPVWTAGVSAKAKLVGKMNKASGKVQVRVESITPEGSAGNAAEDVD